ncbi:MAG: ATP-dependent Clp protease ATP-binding subunit [Candidatus Delongbacteria bacterium]|nr:ATP-dependent Clp protease ATP-binding subunit [Candidatus Cloacimonadota bacterium]MCA9787725.1 ATP-dependent Clp protease ATP-binding subunit [Candidatus Cloacimonadota bacterium]MCB9475039.1 ATP-dependent Clp protease ATP-binding subunit [Candidatus Delongbacteria bacterium]
MSTLPPFLPDALELAARQAHAEGSSVVGAVHLLNALLQSGAVKRDKGLRRASVEALAALGREPAKAPEAEPGEDVELELEPRLQSLLQEWSRGADALDPRSLQRQLLAHWDQLLEGGVRADSEEDQSSEMEQAWLESLFSPELDLNLRYGRTPMAGLLEYEEYLPALMEVLIRRYRQNLLLYGPKGSGRHSVLRRLIENSAAGRVPTIFRGRRFVEFSAEVFLSGVEEPGDLVRRFELLSEYLDRHPNTVLVTDKLQSWLGNENPLLNDFVQRLFGMMDTRSHHMVVLEDLAFYNAVYRPNPALEDLLAPVYIAPMRREDVIQVLREVRSRVEDHYQIPVADDILARVVEQADELLPSLHFPRKALVLLDTTLAILALKEPTDRDWEKALSLALVRITGQARRHYPDLEQRLAALEPLLLDRVIGQEHAIHEICRSLRFQKSDLDLEPERPDGVYLLVGPVGVGKQVLVNELSLQLYGRKPFVIDLMDFQEPESLLRLTSSPEGQGASLAMALHNMPRSVLLFKNLEYAAEEVLHFLLQCITTGRVRDARGTDSPISELTVVLLSDLVGLSEHRGTMGFVDPEQRDPFSELALREYFSPELLRAVDKTVVFLPLAEEVLMEILRRKLLPELEQRLKRIGHRLVVCEDVIQHIAETGIAEGRNAQTLNSDFRRLLAMPVNEALLASPGQPLYLTTRIENDQIVVDALPLAEKS